MAEGYDCTRDGDCSCLWLDELLCEYVDGTMDAVVREAFEEYLTMNPPLAKQVEHLRRTRTLLTRHGCRLQTPQGLRARIRRRLAWELMPFHTPRLPETASRLGIFVAVSSVMAAVVMVSMLVGVALLEEESVDVADRAAGGSEAVRQEARGASSAAMTPLSGRRPADVPVLTPQPSLLALPLVPSYEQMPHLLLQPAGLQRTRAVP